MLVWLFAMLAGAQTVASTLNSIHDGNVFASVVWAATTLVVVFLATSLESVKQFLEGPLE